MSLTCLIATRVHRVCDAGGGVEDGKTKEGRIDSRSPDSHASGRFSMKFIREANAGTAGRDYTKCGGASEKINSPALLPNLA